MGWQLGRLLGGRLSLFSWHQRLRLDSLSERAFRRDKLGGLSEVEGAQRVTSRRGR